MRRDFVVLSVPCPEGERFAIFRPDDWMRSSSPVQWSRENLFEAMKQFVDALELLPEDSLRVRLESMGFAEDAVTTHIARARNMARLNQQGIVWEVVTAAGYRNEEGQEVVARTPLVGSEPEQRVYAMKCTVCGHEYGTNGCDIPHRCCPNCQDGAPGLPVRWTACP
jgi:hypothetical protein